MDRCETDLRWQEISSDSAEEQNGNYKILILDLYVFISMTVIVV